MITLYVVYQNNRLVGIKSHHQQEISSWIISSLLSCFSDMKKCLWQKFVENKFAKIFLMDCRQE